MSLPSLLPPPGDTYFHFFIFNLVSGKINTESQRVNDYELDNDCEDSTAINIPALLIFPISLAPTSPGISRVYQTVIDITWTVHCNYPGRDYRAPFRAFNVGLIPPQRQP